MRSNTKKIARMQRTTECSTKARPIAWIYRIRNQRNISNFGSLMKQELGFDFQFSGKTTPITFFGVARCSPIQSEIPMEPTVKIYGKRSGKIARVGKQRVLGTAKTESTIEQTPSLKLRARLLCFRLFVFSSRLVYFKRLVLNFSVPINQSSFHG